MLARVSGGRLDGRTVVVTGGNGGIGLGIGEAAADAGASVMIWARNETKSASAVDGLRARGARAAATICDVADERSVDAAMDETLATFGRVDAVVANAAITGGISELVDLDLTNWRAVLDTNLTGVMLAFRAGARQMVAQGEPGSLLAVSSIVSRFGAAGRSPYAVSKTAIDALVKSAAIELARHRIRCNSLAPGWTRTDLVEDGFDPTHATRFEQAIMARTPSRRWGTTTDYADAAVLLIDPSLSFHTGDHITIDGGYAIF